MRNIIFQRIDVTKSILLTAQDVLSYREYCIGLECKKAAEMPYTAKKRT